MNNKSFDFERIALGYAKDRPWLHPQVIERLRKDLQIEDNFHNGLDVGCGAGLSTKALMLICDKVTGTDISEEMIKVCKVLYPESEYTFTQSPAEAAIAEENTFDIVTAAGVINWVDEDKFLHNLRRIMYDKGLLCIYDFGISDRMENNEAYTKWYQEDYLQTFPKPPRKEYTWTNDNLIEGFGIVQQVQYQLTHEFDKDSFIRFMMIQSNVNAQIDAGQKSVEKVKRWFEETLQDIWVEERHTLIFNGYSWYIELNK
ncbi:MAG: class I SAM-dependent methyltransferase [Lachnospiraceae bacterium]|nr:class I SAM-dependent methyltransferase [Lachnospiraceae bacterium]